MINKTNISNGGYKMSYHEKRIVVSILSGIALVAAYCVYAYGKVQSGLVAPGDLKFWAVTMLIFIGIGVAATIVIQIVFHILLSIGIAVKEKMRDENFDEKLIEQNIKAEMVEDEMDKLIDLKSSRISQIFTGVGFAAGLVSLILGYSPEWMLNILFFSFFLGSLFEGFGQLYYYRKGLAHG